MNRAVSSRRPSRRSVRAHLAARTDRARLVGVGRLGPVQARWTWPDLVLWWPFAAPA